MGTYSNILNTITSTVYENSNGAVTATVLQGVLQDLVDVLGAEGAFMGILADGNKPTETIDGKQFYIGYTASTTQSIDLTAVGLGTISIEQGDIYIVYADSTGWKSVNMALSIKSRLTTLTNTIASLQTDSETALLNANRSLAMQGCKVVSATTGTSIISTADSLITYNLTADKASTNGRLTVQALTDEIYVNYGDTIPTEAFSSTALSSITIPSNVTTLKDGAIKSNASLTSITFLSVTPPAATDGSIQNNEALAAIYVPEVALSVYQGAYSDTSWVGLITAN